MLATTSANAITTVTISYAITSVNTLRSAYMYCNNIIHTKILEILCKNIFPHTSFGVQNCWNNIFYKHDEAMLDK